jgi:hypothetical protein
MSTSVARRCNSSATSRSLGVHEAGIEQPELGLEVLMHGRRLAFQTSTQ